MEETQTRRRKRKEAIFAAKLWALLESNFCLMEILVQAVFGICFKLQDRSLKRLFVINKRFLSNSEDCHYFMLLRLKLLL